MPSRPCLHPPPNVWCGEQTPLPFFVCLCWTAYAVRQALTAPDVVAAVVAQGLGDCDVWRVLAQWEAVILGLVLRAVCCVEPPTAESFPTDFLHYVKVKTAPGGVEHPGLDPLKVCGQSSPDWAFWGLFVVGFMVEQAQQCFERLDGAVRAHAHGPRWGERRVGGFAPACKQVFRVVKPCLYAALLSRACFVVQVAMAPVLPGECEFINGVMFRKILPHKSMREEVSRPKVLLLDGRARYTLLFVAIHPRLRQHVSSLWGRCMGCLFM
jgi:hypothetical protein